MSKTKYIMPVARILTSGAVLITAGIRQAGPDGSPLTLAIFFSATVTGAQGAIDLHRVWNQPEKISEPLQEVVTESTTWRKAIIAERAAAVASNEVEKILTK